MTMTNAETESTLDTITRSTTPSTAMTSTPSWRS
jgi:hypothetical protein